MKAVKIEVHKISDERTYDTKYTLCSSSGGDSGSSGSSSNGVVLKKVKLKNITQYS